MKVYYFDTSALAKHYQDEAGTAAVDALLQDPTNRVVIARFGVTEVISALARRVRTGELPAASFPPLLLRLRRDVSLKQFGILRILQAHFATADRLIAAAGVNHQVRTLDALHLSVALAVHEQGGLAGFVCSDGRLAALAADQGLPVIDPVVAAGT